MRFVCLVLAYLATAGVALSATYFPPVGENGPVRTLNVYSTLDETVSRPLIDAFQKANPGIAVSYEDLQSLDIYERILRETDEGQTADLVISSAMDLQVKLANDGYAREVSGAEVDGWPNWAKWRDSVFGLTFEPSVIVYHKPSFEGVGVPRNRAELIGLLKTSEAELYGRIATYDVERSGLGFLFLARDREHSRDIWSLVSAFGTAGVKLYSNSSAILDRVADGRFALGYNILGSYAQSWASRIPDLGIILPEDYTVVMSRIALVPEAAADPDLGEAMLAFLMSEEGQTIMARDARLPALHPLVEGDNTASALRSRFGARLRPISISPGLVVYLDQVKRARFISRWNDALQSK
ncbi:ABC transporter substrate-binding protein [Hoeflea prorocentri]|uniref:ABC transporter substrate-binding protein n=1 Tax=Hoeflea prorocentri TaxID=1922333 RepID=A0A9X3UKY6_9HYPH|nr:ABC transporter substrate-binding protein [Hoeflea prorocentri]MCY6382554.1 ABC transporter substrate-binding protein [Hoeflea prorocentri]MDA5400354.1 ABC transporter substrate-binding protein [Hoeflea prorocentri]